jgi:hypothetical protein
LKDEAGLGFDHRAQFSESLAQGAHTIHVILCRASAIKLEGSPKRRDVTLQRKVSDLTRVAQSLFVLASTGYRVTEEQEIALKEIPKPLRQIQQPEIS